MLDFARPMANRYNYVVPTDAELRDLALAAGVDEAWASRNLRLPIERIQRILAGEEVARHHMRVILSLLALPGAVRMCEAVTTATPGKMTAAQFRSALESIRTEEGRPISSGGFARLYGVANDRTRDWSRKGDIPHVALVMLSLLTMPGALEMAESVTDSVITDTRSPST